MGSPAQVSTTLALASRHRVGEEHFELQYSIVPYTCAAPLDLQDTPDGPGTREGGSTDAPEHASSAPSHACVSLPFFVECFSESQFALRPYTDGIHALYHRHHASEADWMAGHPLLIW